MATSMPQNVPTGAGRVSPFLSLSLTCPNHHLQAFAIGGSIVALTLGGFYLNLRRMKEKETARGVNPMCTSLPSSLPVSPFDLTPTRTQSSRRSGTRT